MSDLVYLIPLAPLLGFVILFCTLGNLPKKLVALVGVGSVGLSASIVLLVGLEFLLQADADPYTVTLYTWMNVGGFVPKVSFYIDGLSLIMMFVITGVGLLIHIYSSSSATGIYCLHFSNRDDG